MRTFARIFLHPTEIMTRCLTKVTGYTSRTSKLIKASEVGIGSLTNALLYLVIYRCTCAECKSRVTFARVLFTLTLWRY